MREMTTVVVCAAVCAALTFCGGDNRGEGNPGGMIGTTCAAVCEAVKKCDPDEAEECMEECPQMREAFQTGVWNGYANCVQGAECEDQDDCMDKAIESAPESNLDGFIDTVCDWMAGCAGAAGGMTRSECEKFMRGEGGDPGDSGPMDVFRAFKTSILDCLADCIADQDCGVSDFEEMAKECADQCGLPMGSSSESSSQSESSGDWPGDDPRDAGTSFDSGAGE